MARTYYRPDRGKWWLDYIDSQGRRRRCSGGDTRSEAELALAMRISKAAYVRAGLADRRQVQMAEFGEAPIGKHIDAWQRSLSQRRRTAKHIREARRCIDAWIKACDVTCLNDIEPARAEMWLGSIVDAGRSHRTHNVYLTRAKEFCGWCVKQGRLAANPLVAVHPLNDRHDRRRVSRAMTPQEYARLVDAAPASRKLFYLLAGRMGLRWSETASLRREQFRAGYLMLDAADTKSRRADDLPVPAQVWKALPKRPGRLFASSPTLITWKGDLVRAGLVRLVDPSITKQCERYALSNLEGYITDAGQLDRKCLRKTFGTALATAGVDLRIAQRLLRHSDPALTANIYTDPVLLDMRAATEAAAGQASGESGQESVLTSIA